MTWLVQLYSRRIVNINVNVITAGLLAGLLTIIPVHMTRHLGIDDKNAIIAVAVISDILFDVTIYYVLHWVANHMPHRHRPRPAEGEARPSFLRDATLVQFERAMLAPVYYGVFLWLQYKLLHAGYHREVAALLSLVAGILSTRVLHSAWMIWQDHRARRRAMGRLETFARAPERTARPTGGTDRRERRSTPV